MSETARLWIVWVWLAWVHVLYYMSGWCHQRRQLREAEEQAERAELQRRMSVPVPEGTSGPWRWCSAGGWTPVLPQVPADPGLMDTLTGRRPIEVLPVAEWPCDPGCVLRHVHRME